MSDELGAYLLGAAIGILVFGLVFIARRDWEAERDCESRTCPSGRPILIERLRCVCATEAP